MWVKNMDRRIRIENVLLECGMQVSRKGFVYIVDATLLFWSYKDSVKWNDIYQSIADKHNDNAIGVRSSIISALKKTRECNANYDMIEKYLGFAEEGNSATISRLCKRIELDEINETHHDNVVTQSMIDEMVRSALQKILMEKIIGL